MMITSRSIFRFSLAIILWLSLLGAALPAAQTGVSLSAQAQPAAQAASPQVESRLVSFAAGAAHTCAVVQTSTGSLVTCWGDNTAGELGNGNNSSSDLPVAVAGLPSNVIQVSASQGNTCALTADSKVYCWGMLRWGGVSSNTPQLMSGMPLNVVEIALANLHLCLCTAAGAAMCPGNNSIGELGNNSTSPSDTPVNVFGLCSGVVSIKTGYLHTCALTSGGAVVCWGADDAGQLGDGGNQNQNAPVTVTGLGGVSG